MRKILIIAIRSVWVVIEGHGVGVRIGFRRRHFPHSVLRWKGVVRFYIGIVLIEPLI